ncbi:MAG: tetratricopeptide repeat protein, partial [Chlorobi bacterium]|nr:tetratricopeptide repeat protein [Chlorobiota bacterium]
MTRTENKILTDKKNNQSFMKFVASLFILILVGSNIILSQESGIISAAKVQMEEGKYSEAIDLLNNYISAEPRRAEGYALRAECYDNTGQYYKAVLDWEKATKLDPTNQVLQSNLAKSKAILNNNLQEKIKGHERELAIDPSASGNYLAIGKAYKQMEDYPKAEKYYDKYLSKVPETSPDEILRYAEILAKNNHIRKGEKILKEYADKYPDDWRLQSRYGYFLMWNGKYRSAKKRFSNALQMKPYFKEAQDGWDVVSRKAYVTQSNPIPRVREYPIDRDYRLLKK